MAQYDRRILIPYLHDVCSIELICIKLDREVRQSTSRIKQLENTVYTKHKKPEYPQNGEKKADYTNGVVFIVFGVLALLAGLLWIRWLPFLWLVGAVGLALGALFLFCGFFEISEEKRKVDDYYRSRYMGYERALKEYNQKMAAMPSMNCTLQQEKNNRTRLVQELGRALNLKKELYSVNIIPSQYRNIYAVYYLYEFMSSGRETDLEKVIQTFVLEEIKKRLDKIISQNEQIIVNQRVQTALQEEQNRTISNNHREQMRQFAQMRENQSLQTEYLQMIDKNQKVTNYILTADYIRKYYR